MPPDSIKSITIFFPAYYDEKSIPILTKKFHGLLKKTGRQFEIIIVDDGSPDNTGKVADRLAKQFSNVRVIHHPKNRGYGGALISGFTKAKTDLVGFTDGDAQYNVEEFPQFLEAIKEADLVIGFRKKRAEGFSRRFTQKIYKLLLFLLFGITVKDPDCSYKLARRKIFEKIKLTSNSGFISAELIYKAKKNGFRIKQVPVTHLKRPFGNSTFFGLKRIADLRKDIVRVRFKE
ncbi:MAG: glycosyltransferase family 2 protein [Candidatus Diapherotrites archaeon]|nr:glycosyltransferase family 2 protein [Candidatus Diapherotrites archaeon]